MTRTEELMKLAEAATSKSMISVIPFRVAANPETIKQLVKLVRMQNAALKYAADKVYSEQNDDEIGIAIEAFNKFEGGEL